MEYGSEEKKILDKLKEVVDPEINFDIVSLGLIEEIKIEDKKVFIKMIPTTPFCPYLPLLVEMIEEKLKEIGYESEVEIDFDKVWSLDMASEEVKKELGLI
ncbi:MAG: metal-sulfur cluster assembly factor [Candidatus Aenigmatarchaeota archaeon]